MGGEGERRGMVRWGMFEVRRFGKRQRDVETEVEQRDRDRGTKRAAVRRQRDGDAGETTRRR